MNGKFASNPILLIVGIPVLFIVVVSVIGYLTTSMVQPSHSFLYVVGDRGWYGYTDNFYVADGSLEARILPGTPEPPESDIDAWETWRAAQGLQLFVFDPETWSATPIALDAALALTLNPSPVAPDGYAIRRSNSGSDFPFFWSGRDGSEYVIYKGSFARTLPIQGTGYGGDIFIGWIIE